MLFYIFCRIIYLKNNFNYWYISITILFKLFKIITFNATCTIINKNVKIYICCCLRIKSSWFDSRLCCGIFYVVENYSSVCMDWVIQCSLFMFCPVLSVEEALTFLWQLSKEGLCSSLVHTDYSTPHKGKLRKKKNLSLYLAVYLHDVHTIRFIFLQSLFLTSKTYQNQV